MKKGKGGKVVWKEEWGQKHPRKGQEKCLMYQGSSQVGRKSVGCQGVH